MAVRALVRIPTSVSRNGACKSNLRGFQPGAPYDYVNPSRIFTVGASLTSISTSGAGTWSNTIQWAYQSTDSEGDPSITYSSLLSTSTSGTILLRIYIQSLLTPPALQTIFLNGIRGANGYGIELVSTFNAELDAYDYTLRFTRLNDTEATDTVKLNSSTTIPVDSWQQFSIRFNTSIAPPPREETVSEITSYQNGDFVVQRTMTSPIVTPTPPGITVVMNFYGRLTDFAFLETQLSTNELALFGSAPYT
jgi:hypothetical protein